MVNTKRRRAPYVPGMMEQAHVASVEDQPSVTSTTSRRNVRREERRPRESLIRLYVFTLSGDGREDTGCTGESGVLGGLSSVRKNA
jgi:hypothetical protein